LDEIFYKPLQPLVHIRDVRLYIRTKRWKVSAL